ncbi:hypothetical protein ANN_22196 [Periplaneta americana]|uniref:Uncharacterized protein n=1 Tax=Periplaneta americana TaxID=6978 RepID=A0ABQ8S7S7_PERAM|nr:hypothetical protein ANN_22196 [Periplaneta americana]
MLRFKFFQVKIPWLSRLSSWLRTERFGVRSRVVMGFSSLPNFQNGPEVYSPSYKIEYRVFFGVKGGQSVVPTTPPHSSAVVKKAWALPSCPQVPS